MEAYEETIRETATDDAPWYVVPADRKWFTRVIVAAAVIDALASLDLHYPKVSAAKLEDWRRRGRRSFARSRRQREGAILVNLPIPRPEANKELLALGLTNLIGGLFQNMPSGGGTSQTAVNRSAGARSQIAGLVAAAAVAAVVIDCSAIPDFEYTAIRILTEAERKLRQSGVSLSLAALNPEPLRLIQKSALGKTLGRQRMHFNLEEAVRAFQARPTDSKSSAAA